VSDDFSGSVLDSSVWSVSDPLGDGSFVMTGTQLAISVGAGAVHDPWSGANTTARVMQPANDTDFELEVKFESDVTRAYQGQGILVQESAGRFLRFDVFSDGSSVHVFSAMIDGATATTKLNQKVGLSAPMWLRVSRTGNVWSLSTSNDGTSFTPRTSFTQTLTVTQVGAFAGNFGTASRPPPAHTALIDYFFNTASPITPEDG
jgi:regulation of enolase protein 1 (concanavalin A-like superfamily)